ncbi:hypothetical protein L6Q96_01760 [Candidatus Binatia bacterium]|nr:hypothetical protein [Candidatus Binatia bacterium]
MQDLLQQFLLHPYITSAGCRYLPRLLVERILVEFFPESPEPPGSGPLLAALGLRRRRQLSRVEIEAALLENGPRIVEHELGLDLRAFRLVRIPPDAYIRLGLDSGWGRQPFWTHFDGYRVQPDGHLPALVGGDARYGGVYDLCGIDPRDAREGVIARFAVVHRDRLSH